MSEKILIVSSLFKTLLKILKVMLTKIKVFSLWFYCK